MHLYLLDVVADFLASLKMDSEHRNYWSLHFFADGTYHKYQLRLPITGACMSRYAWMASFRVCSLGFGKYSNMYNYSYSACLPAVHIMPS